MLFQNSTSGGQNMLLKIDAASQFHNYVNGGGTFCMLWVCDCVFKEVCLGRVWLHCSLEEAGIDSLDGWLEGFNRKAVNLLPKCLLHSSWGWGEGLCKLGAKVCHFKDFSRVTLIRFPVSVTCSKINTFKKHILQKLNPSISCVNSLIFFGLKDPIAKQCFP